MINASTDALKSVPLPVWVILDVLDELARCPLSVRTAEPTWREVGDVPTASLHGYHVVIYSCILIDLSKREPAMGAKPWMQLAEGVVLDVRVTPRSGRDAIGGIEYRADGRPVLKARVRAAPFEGDANDALRRLIARELGIAPRQVEITATDYRRRANARCDTRAADRKCLV